MSPDYELEPSVAADTPARMKAIANPLRSQILDLVLERAATVTELAEAVGRPKSSIAYHVDLLVDVGLLRVVRTRQVRAIEERFYGRVGRTIVLGDALPAGAEPVNMLAEAQAEARVPSPGKMLATLRHARIPADRADEFFSRVNEIAEEFTTLERDGDTVYGFVAAVYPTDHPTLPEAGE
ncbi:ArsR/SmtB family transcription factor [Ilumatobacter coccineus]|jgi:DNA-binding transcriptional ArsR family regulator|nr:winged helix-turn-helix domain-containing protein [Ilumatobacter coccineus]